MFRQVGFDRRRSRHKLSTQETRADRAGGRANRPCNLPKTCPLFSQPCHLVAIDYPTRSAQRLPFEYRVAQPGPDSFLNERAFKLGHRSDDLKHEPTGWSREVQIVAEAHEGDAVGIEVSECIDEVL